MKSVLAFGEILWDIIEGAHHLGGAPLNFAAHYRQCGGKSGIISRVGNDELGAKALQTVRSLEVNDDLVQIDGERQTGTVTVTLNNGQPSYVIHKNVAYDEIEMPDSKISDQGYDAFYFGTLAQRNKKSQQTLLRILTENKFDEVFYDVNLRVDQYAKQVILDSMEHCTILKLNDEEVIELGQLLYNQNFSFDQFAKHAFTLYNQLNLIIVTMGAKGCSIYRRGEQVTSVPSDKIEVKDTVGAGDSFIAAFTYAYLQGKSAEQSAQIANKIAGYVASSNGAIPTYPPHLKALLS